MSVERTKHRLEVAILQVNAARQIPDGVLITDPDIIVTRELRTGGFEDVTEEFEPSVVYEELTKTFKVVLRDGQEDEQRQGEYYVRIRAFADGDPIEIMQYDREDREWRPVKVRVTAKGDPDAP